MGRWQRGAAWCLIGAGAGALSLYMHGQRAWSEHYALANAVYVLGYLPPIGRLLRGVVHR